MRLLLAFLTFVCLSPVAQAETQNGEPEFTTVPCRVLDQETGTVTEETMQFSGPAILKVCQGGEIVFIEQPDFEKLAGDRPVVAETKGEKKSAE